VKRHLDYRSVDPASYEALRALEDHVQGSSLEKGIRHLIYLRVSQLNGCAFCMALHEREARLDGEDEQRLDSLADWRDSPFFRPHERSAFELAERLTRLPQKGIPELLQEELGHYFRPRQIVDLIMAVIAINAWNRINIATGREPG
jgi:AhpD family alkylhydroperoxidase